MKKFALLVVLLSLGSTFAAAAIRPFELSTLEKLGNEMFEQDIRAARATDIVRGSSFDLASAGASGWIVVTEGAKTTVRFFGEKDGNFRALVDVVFTGTEDGKLVKHEPFALPEPEVKLARARLTVSRISQR
ncbi:MAG: hypothetical protein QM760_20585 [Nibricoccus sp.]